MTLLNGTHEPPAPCYFMEADVLGFSNIIKNLPSAEQNERVNNWIQIVESVKTEAKVEKTQLISDTLFIMEENSEQGLGRMLKFARLLMKPMYCGFVTCPRCHSFTVMPAGEP